MINTKFKSFLLLSVTLIIGIIIGFIAKSWIMDHRFERFGKLMSKGGFLQVIDESINLTDEQKDTLAPILENYREKMSEHAAQSRKDFHRLLDSLKTSLKDVLTEEQYNELMKDRMFHPPDRFKKSRKQSDKKPDSLKSGFKEVQ